MFIKDFIINRIKGFLFDYEHPRYRTFVYHMSRQYVDFYRGEHNSKMETNGEGRLIRKLFSGFTIGTVFDVGANVGEYAERIVKARSDARIHCFEPDPRAFALLKERIGGESRAFLNNAALDSARGLRDMHISGEASELNSFHDMGYAGRPSAMRQVRTETLDAYCRDKKVPHIDFLKIDVEGHELAVLEGSRGMLAGRSVDFIQFEFGNAAAYARVFFRDIFGLLDGYGYKIYKIKPLALEQVAYSVEYEKIMYANFLAVRLGKDIGGLL